MKVTFISSLQSLPLAYPTGTIYTIIKDSYKYCNVLLTIIEGDYMNILLCGPQSNIGSHCYAVANVSFMP